MGRVAAGQVDGYFLGFFFVVVVVSLGLIAWRGGADASGVVAVDPATRTVRE